MKVRIEEGWGRELAPVFESEQWLRLAEFVRREYATTTVYPPAGRIFAAMDICPFDRVKVVILGQDPYHGPGQANGLAFSVADGVALPPSLVNIFKEVGGEMPRTGNLERWARQGVLLLNSSLTVRAAQAASHSGMGWEQLTDAAIAALSDRKEHLVFMLWGSHAQRKLPLIDTTKHLVLTAPHPSPLSAYRGFLGCGHFRKANEYLTANGLTPIEW